MDPGQIVLSGQEVVLRLYVLENLIISSVTRLVTEEREQTQHKGTSLVGPTKYDVSVQVPTTWATPNERQRKTSLWHNGFPLPQQALTHMWMESLELESFGLLLKGVNDNGSTVLNVYGRDHKDTYVVSYVLKWSAIPSRMYVAIFDLATGRFAKAGKI